MGGFRLGRFGERLREVRKLRKQTLRDVSVLTRISVPTLSRIERGDGKEVESKTLLVLSTWAGLPLELFSESTEGTIASRTSSVATPDVVELHLRADKNLNPRTAELLAKMFRAAYAEAASHGED